jgi:hypothetical protein
MPATMLDFYDGARLNTSFRFVFGTIPAVQGTRLARHFASRYRRVGRAFVPEMP